MTNSPLTVTGFDQERSSLVEPEFRERPLFFGDEF